MTAVKLAIVFYSTYSTNLQMARIAAEAAEAAGAEVRLRRVAETAPAEVVNGQDAWKATLDKMQDIPVATPDDMEWANAYLFSAPTRFGQAPSQMRAFIDTLGGLWFKGALAGKPVTAMTSAQNPHGGQEATILGLYTTFAHWGSIIVPPGFTDQAIFAAGGNPYGYSHTQGKEFDDNAKAAIGHQARRLVDVAAKLG
ncbi:MULTISPECIES: NAD(P)H:quinone oxidoreductase type IV [Gemmobacter]|jgi:NAD(P)H dehydrogenase (quinone)|uniref:NAD(P)H dehydrogenase (Quinone) n=2 Tax=Gemmobacter TaxID=204456 RepID=A0A2T6ASQ0_9RHOB|nr:MULTISPECIES: NAD(P)H:quinone oxidoreductase type IV [Gemmobacter]PTX46837.1 NAD(P)H dehydrogenase (quinone) [Gemmobacter caeni]TWI95689.1 NAD(P)H dehydrogenase (quinone) [Gemmobacter caeni]GHC23426.1 trp repressor-binding protein WrbA [Gemmobacter nanjingensis]